mmetsp:Transcript_3537/g.7613  ORF Transcript_3537/g.7613 Transcript_3537/m.7613 type:complete len:209 (+) Transcript_3537:2291-2917(+)
MRFLLQLLPQLEILLQCWDSKGLDEMKDYCLYPHSVARVLYHSTPLQLVQSLTIRKRGWNCRLPAIRCNHNSRNSLPVGILVVRSLVVLEFYRIPEPPIAISRQYEAIRCPRRMDLRIGLYSPVFSPSFHPRQYFVSLSFCSGFSRLDEAFEASLFSSHCWSCFCLCFDCWCLLPLPWISWALLLQLVFFLHRSRSRSHLRYSCRCRC